MISDYVQPAIVILGGVVVSIFGYYAIKLLGSFRSGMLAKGWKYVTIGATFLVLAQFPFLASSIGSASDGFLLNIIGAAMRFAGMISMTIGLRAQYEIWRLDNKVLASSTESSVKPIKA